MRTIKITCIDKISIATNCELSNNQICEAITKNIAIEISTNSKTIIINPRNIIAVEEI